MSYVFLKSTRLLKNADGNTILINNSELPYNFINTFKEPLKITPESKIEVVSADLNIEPLHDINTAEDNDAFTFCIDKEENQFLQKLVKIPNGVYNNQLLSSKISVVINDNNLLDGNAIIVEFSVESGFEFYLDPFYSRELEILKNNYILIMSKMGFQASTAQQNAGIGTDSNEITIENNNDISFPNTITKNSTLSVLTSTNLTQNTLKPTNIISNAITSNERGINNAGGSVSTIFRPIKHLVYGGNFLSESTGKTFSVVSTSTVTGLTIAAYTGSNSYDFQIDIGGTIHYFAFVKTKTFWDTLTLPNSLSTGNLPWGHFLIVNNSDVAINTTLDSNSFSLLLDTNDYKWKIFTKSVSVDEFTFSCDNDANYVKGKGTITSLGNWGSCATALSRGECTITGTNQMNNTNRFTRARIVNETGDSNTTVNKDIYADYGVLLTPTVNGTDTFVQVQSGTQNASKVAGQTDWISITKQTLSDSLKLSQILPTSSVNDNVIINMAVTSHYFVTITIAHDTDGNCIFKNNKIIATNHKRYENVADVLFLPTNFNESSYPINSMIASNNGYIKNEQQTLSFGFYSKKLISTHSLAKLNAYMNTTWGSSQTIPVRQPKSTIDMDTDMFNVQDRDLKIEPNGFSGVNTITDYTMIDSTLFDNGLVKENTNFLVKLGMPINKTPINNSITENGFNLIPPDNVANRNPFISNLYLNLGMSKVILESVYQDFDDDEDVIPGYVNSTNEIIYNNTSNFIINFDNLGKIVGQNAETNSISQIATVIPATELEETSKSNLKHFKSAYPQPVNINAKTTELINNFNVSITTDDGRPATHLRHPISILCRLT